MRTSVVPPYHVVVFVWGGHYPLSLARFRLKRSHSLATEWGVLLISGSSRFSGTLATKD